MRACGWVWACEWISNVYVLVVRQKTFPMYWFFISFQFETIKGFSLYSNINATVITTYGTPCLLTHHQLKYGIFAILCDNASFFIWVKLYSCHLLSLSRKFKRWLYGIQTLTTGKSIDYRQCIALIMTRQCSSYLWCIMETYDEHLISMLRKYGNSL